VRVTDDGQVREVHARVSGAIVADRTGDHQAP
jgi:hypothetical protein